jgi:hypothetical protein
MPDTISALSCGASYYGVIVLAVFVFGGSVGFVFREIVRCGAD